MENDKYKNEYIKIFDKRFIISAGLNHSAVLIDHDLILWGANNYSQSRVPDELQNKILDVSLGNNHTMVLLKDGTLKSWGDNSQGQLNIPIQQQEKVKLINSKSNLNICLTEGNILYLWGNNKKKRIDLLKKRIDKIFVTDFYFGFLSDNELTVKSTKKSHNFKNVTDFASGTLNLVVSYENKLTFKEASKFENVMIPPKIRKKIKIEEIQKISSGHSHIIFLKKNGSIIGIGDNSFSQIEFPDKIKNNVKDVYCGNFHTVALLENDEVVCWGKNDFGQCSPPKKIMLFERVPTYNTEYQSENILETDINPQVNSEGYLINDEYDEGELGEYDYDEDDPLIEYDEDNVIEGYQYQFYDTDKKRQNRFVYYEKFEEETDLKYQEKLFFDKYGNDQEEFDRVFVEEMEEGFPDLEMENNFMYSSIPTMDSFEYALYRSVPGITDQNIKEIKKIFNKKRNLIEKNVYDYFYNNNLKMFNFLVLTNGKQSHIAFYDKTQQKWVQKFYGNFEEEYDGSNKIDDFYMYKNQKFLITFQFF